jgi:hypothetical protein
MKNPASKIRQPYGRSRARRDRRADVSRSRMPSDSRRRNPGWQTL